MGSIASVIFSGPAVIVPQLLMLGVGGWVGEYILAAIGKGREAQMLRMGITFTGILLVLNVLIQVLGKALAVMGL